MFRNKFLLILEAMIEFYYKIYIFYSIRKKSSQECYVFIERIFLTCDYD